MKRMSVIFALVGLSVSRLASAEMLYWMIGDATNGGSNAIEFNYAVVYAAKGDERIMLPNDGTGGEIYGDQSLSPITTSGPNLTEFGGGFDWSSYSYYVELLSWDGANEATVGVSEWATYDALVSHGAIVPSGMVIPPTAHVWMPTTTVPEPTSTVLLLLGLSLLLLRRSSNNINHHLCRRRGRSAAW